MQKEYYEWIHSWCDATTENDLPRVLLVGDSITHAYNGKVREMLKGVCYVDYIATSYAIDTKIYNTIVESFAKDSNYALIHFNHGLHGIHMSKKTYKSRMKKLLTRLGGKISVVTSTVVYKAGNKTLHTKWKHRLEERNSAVKELASELGLGLDDLFEVSLTVPKDLRAPDGVHYQDGGSEILAKAVVENIKSMLK